MVKKTKPSKSKNHANNSPSQADKMYDAIGQQLFAGDYAGVVISCEHLLDFLPTISPLRVDVLAQLGTAHGLLKNFPQAYAILSEALLLAPNDADLWSNRGMASRLTLRLGQSFKDFTRAAELNKDPHLSRQINRALAFSRKVVNRELKLRGRAFTLEQLIEQEEHFQRGLTLMDARQWDEAGQAFQACIAMGDCLPQPWGNLGICLLMQERYDESEAALKRALVIDRHYRVAKNNLKLLAKTRRTGPPAILGAQDPFQGRKIKQGITYVGIK
jgi:tetratricopeptide (TPR) repeat protein